MENSALDSILKNKYISHRELDTQLSDELQEQNLRRAISTTGVQNSRKWLLSAAVKEKLHWTSVQINF